MEPQSRPTNKPLTLCSLAQLASTMGEGHVIISRSGYLAQGSHWTHFLSRIGADMGSRSPLGEMRTSHDPVGHDFNTLMVL